MSGRKETEKESWRQGRKVKRRMRRAGESRKEWVVCEAPVASTVIQECDVSPPPRCHPSYSACGHSFPPCHPRVFLLHSSFPQLWVLYLTLSFSVVLLLLLPQARPQLSSSPPSACHCPLNTTRNVPLFTSLAHAAPFGVWCLAMVGAMVYSYGV